MKSECSNGLTRLFGVAASHKRLQVTNSTNLLMLMRLLTRTMKKIDDDKSDGNRNELTTPMMRMLRMMMMMRMLRMRMRMKVRMMIMMSGGAVVGLQFAISIGSSKRKPPNAVIVSRQVL